MPFKYWWLRHSEGAALYSGLGGSGATEYSGSPVKAFSEWIKDINELVADKLVPVLHENDMIVPDLSNYCTENYNLINHKVNITSCRLKCNLEKTNNFFCDLN